MDELNKEKVTNWIFVYMPDNLHLILEGKSNESNLLDSIKYFKQKTGFWLSENGFKAKWQKDFYDHLHRSEKDLRKHIDYILRNPVRKGLVEDWRYYPFLGSLHRNIEDIL